MAPVYLKREGYPGYFMKGGRGKSCRKGGENRVEKGKGKDRRVILELGQRVKEKRLNTGIHAFKLMTSQINDNVSLFYSTRQSALQLSTEWNKSFRTNTNY